MCTTCTTSHLHARSITKFYDNFPQITFESRVGSRFCTACVADAREHGEERARRPGRASRMLSIDGTPSRTGIEVCDRTGDHKPGTPKQPRELARQSQSLRSRFEHPWPPNRKSCDCRLWPLSVGLPARAPFVFGPESNSSPVPRGDERFTRFCSVDVACMQISVSHCHGAMGE